MASDTRGRWPQFGDHAVTGLAVSLVVRRGLESAQVLASERWSRRRLASVTAFSQSYGGGSRIICVVPMYLEQDIAANAVRFWHRLGQRVDIDQVIFVTTEKEQTGRDETTRDIVATELARLGYPERLRLLHCGEAHRFRAAQLNLAVKWAGLAEGSAGPSDDRTWIGVYNADSRPADSTFAELAQCASAEPNTRVYQQLVDYVVPERPGTRTVASGNAVLQTWWTRSHYYARNRCGGRERSWRATRTAYSTFGHGEFIRSDFLNDIGGFPDFAYADGLLLGWICRLRAEQIGLLASRDRAEVPRTARDLVTQQKAWIRGLFNFGATVAWCRRHGHLLLTKGEVAALRLSHGVIPVAWGLSTPAVVAAAAMVSADVARRGPNRVDALRLGALLAYPFVPALVLAGTRAHSKAGLSTQVAGVGASWPIEGLAFWPAVASLAWRRQEAPAKTPR